MLLAGVLTLTSDYWLPYLKGVITKKTAPPTPPAEDTDVLDLKALQRMESRGKRRGCKKLQGAVRELEVSFFNESEPVAEVK